MCGARALGGAQPDGVRARRSREALVHGHAGVGGTKTLQDLFTDRKVPRALRRTLPVVVSGDAVVWVAGVAVDERFAAAPGSDAVGLSATQRPRSAH